ncbi:MAG: zinc ribbon domain-containing protein [Ktedonobacteraceae bacterium]
MNCASCNAPLEPQARFCPKCGATVHPAPPANPAPLYQPQARGESPTIQPAQWSQPQQPQPAPPSWQQPQQPQQAQQPAPGQMILPATRGAPLSPPVYRPASGSQPKKKSRLRGCLLYSLIIVVVLLLLLVGAWFAVARPYADSMAQSQLNNALAQAVTNIPAQVALLPSGGTVPVSDNTINFLLSNQSSSSNIVQNANVTITPQNFLFKFQVFGFPCSVTGVPIASNGKIVITNVTLSGIAGLVMSPDEITTIVNNHLADAVTRINHSITKVTLKQHEVDLTFGPRGGGTPTGTPTTIPTGIPTGIPSAIPTNIPIP